MTRSSSSSSPKSSSSSGADVGGRQRRAFLGSSKQPVLVACSADSQLKYTKAFGKQVALLPDADSLVQDESWTAQQPIFLIDADDLAVPTGCESRNPKVVDFLNAFR